MAIKDKRIRRMEGWSQETGQEKIRDQRQGELEEMTDPLLILTPSWCPADSACGSPGESTLPTTILPSLT